MRRRAIVLAVIATLGALLLGLILARALSQPLLALTRHVARVGGGDFDARLQLHTARELQTLSTELNTMAGGLKQRVQLEQSLALATHVQQSLLPQAPPQIDALDVAGQSRYCDSTGGDYFDFIDVAPLPGRQVLVAVGDVMGHGIGAALLMATARAAVRATAAAPDGAALGALMSRVNHVLAQDARHGLFMTLSLLVIDVDERAVRWASAGHDPVIVYDPASDQFADLDGGDIPLGVTDGVEYEEFSRDALAQGSVLVVGTDGIWEAKNGADEMYGKARLRELIRRHAADDAKEIAAALERELGEFTGHSPLSDDVTFVVMKLRDVARQGGTVG
jgi:sigma-B regulation protein RsbU (phosphoserine phosphatase)